MAPEVLNGNGYGAKADVYSFALVMYHCLTGKEPYHDVDPLLVMDYVKSGSHPKLPVTSSPELIKLLTR